MPSDLETFLQRLGPSLAALRPRVEALSNVLPWARREGDEQEKDAAADEAAAVALMVAASDDKNSKR